MRSKRLVLSFSIVLSAVIFCSGIYVTQAATIDYDQKITLNLKNAEITDVFRLIAEQNNLNIVVSPTVNGRISLRLSSVTLREAIEVILDATNARIEETENIIHVFSIGERDQLDTEKGQMVTEIFTVNYMRESTLLSVVNDFLSLEGKAKSYRRSKGSPPMIIVQDYPEKVEAVRKMYERLDTETRQIMIDTKIIETGFQNMDIKGIDWSIGAAFSGSPVAIDTKYGGTSGKIDYGTLNFNAFKAVYQRLMEDSATDVLSDAKLAVLDGENAHIHVGETIPVGINTISSGTGGTVDYGTTNIQKWEVGVTVDVTPVVVDNNLIRMKIEPEVSSVDDTNTNIDRNDTTGAPTTSSRYVDTSILIRSGETIVIGGLVQDSVQTTERKVPLLGELPLIGSAFRKKDIQKRKTNMIIFITGRIIGLKGDKDQSEETHFTPSTGVNDREALDKFLEYK